MTLTPVEVRHLEMRRGLFGYRRGHVHHTIEEIADSFEAVWRERSELGERVHELEVEVGRHVELEQHDARQRGRQRLHASMSSR